MKKKQTSDKDTLAAPKLNRHARRAMQRTNRKVRTTRLVKEKDGDKVVYHDDSFKDKTKKVFSHGMDFVKERLAQMKESGRKRPEKINTVRLPFRSSCLVLNRDGKERELLPDMKPCHKILVHRSVAKVMLSKVCLLLRITANETDDGRYIDGSWVISPVDYRMLGTTTIQHVRLRPWFFLRRYWYEIDFDGRVQPASLFYDYRLDVQSTRQRLWLTREYVPVAKEDAYNDYFRLWRDKPPKEVSLEIGVDVGDPDGDRPAVTVLPNDALNAETTEVSDALQKYVH